MGIRVVEVRDNGLVASLYMPRITGKYPGIIVVGGSDGGLDSAVSTASLLAEQGYAALALAYFRFEQLPEHLEEIPLEYFKQAIDWMGDYSEVESSRIGWMGNSKGGEVALLISATYPAIRVVVAYVPSHVVFQGIGNTWPPVKARSSWTFHGESMPFVPYRADPGFIEQHGFPLGLYLGSLQDKEAVDCASIPVERINGPVLLISGKDDAVWPSALMCTRVMERLEQHNFGHSFQHLGYEQAGHIYPGPSHVGPDKLSDWNPSLGGTQNGHALAKDDSWAKVGDFLERYLKQSAISHAIKSSVSSP